MTTDLRAGHRVHRLTWTSGARRALALHCALGQAATWEGLAARLPLDLTAFDLPGHGQSGPWDGTTDYHALCTQIATGLCDGPTDLIGHSFGATVALRVALERPDLARSLTLIEPVFFAAARADDAPEIAAHDAGFAPFVEAFEAGDRTRAARIFTGIWGGGRPFDSLDARRRQALAERIHLIPAGAPGIEDDNAELLAPGRLEHLAPPVLLVRGDRTPPVIAAIHRALMARLPDSRETVVAGAGHMVALTHLDAIALAMRDRFSL